MLTLVESPQNQAVFTAVNRLIARLERPTASELSDVQNAIRDKLAENFANESAGDTPWARLAPLTVRERLEQGWPGAHPIQRRSGHYMSSWIDAIHNNHVSEIVVDGSGITLREGSEDELAIVLNQGTSRIPARPVNELSTRQIDDVGEIMLQWLIEVIEQ